MSAESKFVPESNEEMEDTFELRKIINPAGTAQNINILGKFCLEAVFISAIPLWSGRDTKQQPINVFIIFFSDIPNPHTVHSPPFFFSL